jgi:hypothetical protein
MVLLPDAAKAHLMLIWLLASRKANRLPFDSHYIATQIGARSKVDLKLLLRIGFIRLLPASKTLAACLRAAINKDAKLERVDKRTERQRTDTLPPIPPPTGGGQFDLPPGLNGHGRRELAALKESARVYAIEIGFRPTRRDIREMGQWAKMGYALDRIRSELDAMKAEGRAIAPLPQRRR